MVIVIADNDKSIEKRKIVEFINFGIKIEVLFIPKEEEEKERYKYLKSVVYCQTLPSNCF